jgi:hypothetical protein
MVVKVHFSDCFGVESKVLYDYGAFNVSLINDLPLFIDVVDALSRRRRAFAVDRTT